jgi:hypothetical protein
MQASTIRRAGLRCADPATIMSLPWGGLRAVRTCQRCFDGRPAEHAARGPSPGLLWVHEIRHHGNLNYFVADRWAWSKGTPSRER